MNNQNPVLELRDIGRTYRQGDVDLTILSGVNLSLFSGQTTALVGASGAGKSTLLHMAGLLEKSTAGAVFLRGKSSVHMNDGDRTLARRHSIGFVYQFHHLLPEFTALENIMIPQMIAGKSETDARVKSLDLLDSMGLSARASHRPSRLSGGEQQRVAILRAIANNPSVLLADEPTGNLDETTASLVFSELIQLVKRNNMAALIATHNPDLAKRMDRLVVLQSGSLRENI